MLRLLYFFTLLGAFFIPLLIAFLIVLVPLNVLFAIVFALSDTVITAFCVASFVFLAIFVVIFFVLDFKLDVTSSNFLVRFWFSLLFWNFFATFPASPDTAIPVAVSTAPSMNPDAKAPTYCFALPSFPVAATLNTPPTTPPNKICAKYLVGSSILMYCYKSK